jgi:hypothetical protein
MIAGFVLMVNPRHDKAMTGFLLFIGIALAIGVLSLRYGVDSRTGKRQL